MGRPKGRTAAGAATQSHLFETAIGLFATHGYADTTLRMIAQAAGVSPGLLYKYFPSKAAVVLALYDRLSAELAERALPTGPWRVRALAALRESLAVLGPHREALRALIPVLMGDARHGLLSAETGFSRDRVQGVFLAAVAASRSPPPAALQRPLARTLYAAHLGVVLLWLLDRSPDQRATTEAVGLLEGALPAGAVALRLPAAGRALSRLDQVIGAALFGDDTVADGVASDGSALQDDPP